MRTISLRRSHFGKYFFLFKILQILINEIIFQNKNDSRLVKEMILLAERFSLSVLRMITVSLLAEKYGAANVGTKFETFIDELAEIDQRLRLESDRQIFVRLADDVRKFIDRSGRVRRQ